MNPTLLTAGPAYQRLKEQAAETEQKASNLYAELQEAKREVETKGLDLSDEKVFNPIMEKNQRFQEASKEAGAAKDAYMRYLETGVADGTKEGRLPGDWPDSLSASFIESAKAIAPGGDGTKAFDVTSGGTATSQFYDPQLRVLPQRRLFVRSLIPVKTGLETDKFDYLRQTVATHNAAETAAGALKPTSVYSFERIEDRVRTIAHMSEAVDRALMLDVDNLRNWLDGQLRLGLLLREDSQIVNGAGTGENLRGILSTSGILTLARGTDPHVDVVLKGIIQLRAQANPVEPNGIVMNPLDVQDVLLTRDANGNYQAADSGAVRVDDDGNLTLWGKEVIQSIAIAAGTSLVGDFNQCRIYDREQARVDWAESGALGAAGVEIFSRNQVVARAEERLGFAVERPSAFLSLTGM